MSNESELPWKLQSPASPKNLGVKFCDLRLASERAPGAPNARLSPQSAADVTCLSVPRGRRRRVGGVPSSGWCGSGRHLVQVLHGTGNVRPVVVRRSDVHHAVLFLSVLYHNLQYTQKMRENAWRLSGKDSQLRSWARDVVWLKFYTLSRTRASMHPKHEPLCFTGKNFSGRVRFAPIVPVLGTRGHLNTSIILHHLPGP